MRNAADRPATTAANPRAPSRKASRQPRRKNANGKRRFAPAGTTRKTTICATKTKPLASACGRTIAGESACGKGVKCRGGDGFLGGRIGTAEACETARTTTPLATPKRRSKPRPVPAPRTRATDRQSPRRGGWRIWINTSSQQGAQALYLASIVFEQLNQ